MAGTTSAFTRARALRPELIRQKCEFFVDVQVWPLHNALDVRGWLSNFRPEDELFATHLLNAFMAVPSHFLDEMLAANFRALSRTVASGHDSYAEKRTAWQTFLSQMLVTFPTGEEPSPTDSGPEYARRTRQQVGIDEHCILDPRSALESIGARAPTKTPLVFVDDFVGTGNQFAETWERAYPTNPGSFAEANAVGLIEPFYLPIFCSALGRARLDTHYPGVVLMPVHHLTDRYSALNADGIVWPESLAADGPSFIERESVRAGIPDTNGATTDDWRGFGKQGLTLAVGTSIPDATLPIFYWEEAGWHPLMRRS